MKMPKRSECTLEVDGAHGDVDFWYGEHPDARIYYYVKQDGGRFIRKQVASAVWWDMATDEEWNT